jgi:hypothetical protein
MDNKTSATVFLLVATIFTACAGVTKPDVPDTETQRKVRTDLERSNVAAGDKVYGSAVTPEGRYSFKVQGQNNAETILTCMASKGYSSKLLIHEPSGYVDRAAGRGRFGGEGEPSR